MVPDSVLELVELAEATISDDEVKALRQVIADLSAFIQRNEDAEGSELVRRAWMVVGVMTR